MVSLDMKFRENTSLRNFVIPPTQCGKSSKARSITVFTEKTRFFRQIDDFTKEVTKELISRKFLIVIAFYSTISHCDQ